MEGQKGICRLSVMPVRAEPRDSAEQVTQLLFGEHYEVLTANENGKWLKIRVWYDSYEGWIDHRQFYSISDDYFNEINNSNYQFSLEPVSTLEFRGQAMHILMGGVLPVSQDELFSSRSVQFEGSRKSVQERKDWSFMREIALTFLNSPYQWGGRTHFGIDCSGFTQLVFRLAGYPLWRDASQQVKQGREIADSNGWQPGDLAFFTSDSGRITHVGILLEDEQIIHASGHVRIDKVTSEGIFDHETNRKTHQMAAVRRILKT